MRLSVVAASLAVSSLLASRAALADPPVEAPRPDGRPHAGRLRSPEIPITFESTTPGITLVARRLEFAGWAWGRHYMHRRFLVAYDPICTAPCTMELPRGVYRLALADEEDHVADAPLALRLDRPTALRGEYISHAGTRTAGAIVLVASIVGGIFLIGEGAFGHGRNGNGVEVGGGIALLVGGSIVGGVLLAQRDEAAISIAPPPVAKLAPPRGVRFGFAF